MLSPYESHAEDAPQDFFGSFIALQKSKYCFMVEEQAVSWRLSFRPPPPPQRALPRNGSVVLVLRRQTKAQGRKRNPRGVTFNDTLAGVAWQWRR